MRRLAVLCVAFVEFFATRAQEHTFDSVRHVIKTTTNDSLRAEALGDLSWLLKYSDPVAAIDYGKQGAALARERNLGATEAHCINSVGITFWAKGDYDSAAHYIKQAANIYEQINHKRGEAVAYTNIGLIFQYQGNYQGALDYALKGLRMLEELDEKGNIASTLLNVGNVYFLREEYQQAKTYYFRSLAMKRELEKKVMGQNIQKTLGNIANVYQKLGQHDSAFHYFKAAIPYAIEAADMKNLCLAYTEIGLTFSKERKYDSALYYYGRAQEIYDEGKFVNDFDRATLLLSVSQTYMDMGDFKTAERYGEEALDIGRKLNNLNKLKEAYELLATLYERSGRYATALTAMKNFVVYKDSLVDVEKNKQIAEIQTKYETEKKDNAILLLSRENELKEAAITTRNWVIATLVLTMGIVAMTFIIWRGYQEQKLVREQQEQKMKLRDAQIRAEIESQENERKRFARDLHDGMGQSISALKLMLQSLPVNASLEERVALVERSEILLNDMHQEIRRIAFNLMPHVLVQHGLVTALDESIQRINASGQVLVRVSSYDMPKRLPEVQEISLYRITQEWINNVIKYAQATLIEVQLFGYDNEIVIIIEDDGLGFNPERLERSEGNGWKNIRTRLSLIKGSWELDSAEGRKGTSFILRVPIAVAVPVLTPTTASTSEL